MTEFEKHEGSICDLINVDCPSSGCDNCTKIQKAGWEKALRWTLKINDGSFMPSRYTIEEELKNLK